MFHSIKSDINTSDPDFENMFPDKMGLFRFVSEMAGNYFYLHNFLIKKKINKITIKCQSCKNSCKQNVPILFFLLRTIK